MEKTLVSLVVKLFSSKSTVKFSYGDLNSNTNAPCLFIVVPTCRCNEAGDGSSHKQTNKIKKINQNCFFILLTLFNKNLKPNISGITLLIKMSDSEKHFAPAKRKKTKKFSFVRCEIPRSTAQTIKLGDLSYAILA
jgi:hypothetical protein